MYPFEVWNAADKRYDFSIANFTTFRRSLFRRYPTTIGHPRAELTLITPADKLEDVPLHYWNPHAAIGNIHLPPSACFHVSSYWSTIFEVYPVHARTGFRPAGDVSWRIFVEAHHAEPWGETITLMSTASNIDNPTSHRFAYFRDQYWKVWDWQRCLPPPPPLAPTPRLRFPILDSIKPPKKELPDTFNGRLLRAIELEEPTPQE